MRRRSEVVGVGSGQMDDRSSIPVPGQPARAVEEHVTHAVQGDRIRYTWGKELYAPVQFNSCEVGPFVVETVVREGESYEQAFARAKFACEVKAEVEFKSKVREHLQRVQEAFEMAGRRR